MHNQGGPHDRGNTRDVTRVTANEMGYTPIGMDAVWLMTLVDALHDIYQ